MQNSESYTKTSFLKKILAIIFTAIIVAGVVPLQVFAAAPEKGDSTETEGQTETPSSTEGISDWVTPEEVPAGVEVVERKWTYDLTSYTTSNSPTLDGWSQYKESTWVWGPYGNWSGWTTSYIASSESRQVESRYHAPVTKTQYNYSRWKGTGAYGPWKGSWSGIYCGTYQERGWSDSPLYVFETQYSASKDCYFDCYGSWQDAWYNQQTQQITTVNSYTDYHYRDRSKVYTYYYSKVDHLEKTDELPTGEYISNVQELVKYRLNLNIYDESQNAYIDGNGVIYKLNSTDKLASVMSYVNLDDNITSIDIEIPATVYYNNEKYDVTEIGANSFEYWSELTSITLPESIKKICSEAFWRCSNLISITIPSSVELIDTEAFKQCSALETVKFKNGKTVIGEGAFRSCTALKSVDLSTAVTVIGDYAFDNCTALPEIIVTTSVKTIGIGAFRGCSSLKKAVIGNGVVSIGDQAFYDCVNIQKVSLGISVENIGSKTFSECVALRWMYFIGEKPTIAVDAFESRHDYKKIAFYYNSSKTTWYGVGGWKNDVGFVTKLYLSQTLGYQSEAEWSGYINWYVYNQGDIIYLDENGNDFQGNKYTCDTAGATLTAYNEQESITGGDINIPSKVFFNTVEYSVTSIGDSVFSGSTGLTRVNIGNNISKIGASAFKNCTNLLSVSFGSGVETIGTQAFYGCSSLNGLYFKGTVPTTVGLFAFGGIKSDAFVVRYNYQDSWGATWQNLPVYICDPLTQVENSGYFKDETGVFYTILSAQNKTAVVGKKLSTSAEDPENAQNTGYAGEGAITIADFVDINGDMYMVSGLDRFAFFKSNISSITLGKFIGFEMPDVQPGIWDCTFRMANKLTSITVSKENKVYYSENDVLYKYDKDLTTTPTLLMVYPSQKSSPSFIVPNGVTSINQYAFSNQAFLVNINLNSVVTVGEHAFVNCTKITSITASSVRTVDNNAFENCSALSSINLSAIDTLGNESFYNCSSLGSVTLNGITKIGKQAFTYCNNIKSFSVSNSEKYSTDSKGVLFEETNGEKKLLQYPAGSSNTSYTISDSTVKSIDAYAFYAANNLDTLVLSDTIKTIGEHAFERCSKIKTIYIGAAVSSIGTRAFFDCQKLSEFKVSNDNGYFYADNSGVLFKYKTDSNGQAVVNDDNSYSLEALVCYPAALERISYTIPVGITDLSSGAFAKNTHLKRVIIPASVNAVRDEVFAGCSQLCEVYFKGEIPAEFGEGVVDGTSNELIIYYISENSSWQNGTIPKSLRACTLKAYNAIEELPNSITFTNSYGIVITNSEGVKVKNASVTVDGMSATFTKDSMYVFGMPENYDIKKGVKLSVSCPGYYAYSDTLFLDEELKLSYIAIKHLSTVQGISCNGSDINSKTLSINKWLYSDAAEELKVGNDITISVQSYCDSSYIISKCSIVQNGCVLAVQKPGPSENNGLKKNLTFTIPASKFEPGAAILVYMEVWDNAANKLIDTIHTNLNISIYSQVIPIYRPRYYGGGSSGGSTGGGTTSVSTGIASLPSLGFDLSNPINVKVNSSVSFLKNTPISISWGKVNIKTEIKSQDEVKLTITGKDKTKNGINISVFGSLTLKHYNSKWRVSESTIGASASAKVDFKPFNTTVWIIPLTGKASLSGSGTLSLTLGFNDGNRKIFIKDSTLALYGNLYMEAGVGRNTAAYELSAGAYGSLSSNMNIGLAPNIEMRKWTLSGELGIYLRARLGSVFCKEYKQKLAAFNNKSIYSNGKWFSSGYEFTDEYNQQILNQYLANNYAVTQSTGSTEPYSSENIVKFSDTKALRVYTVDAYASKLGSDYDSYNYSKIVYSVGKFNVLTKVWYWTDPKLLDDNGLGDGNFSVKFDESTGTAYVAYTQMNTRIDENTDTTTALADFEVKAAKWNGSDFEVMSTSYSENTVSSDKTLDTSVILTTVDGMAVLVWTKNTDNNVLGMSNYNYIDEETGKYCAFNTDANEIWYSVYEDDVWSAPERAVGGLPTITSINASNDGTLVFSVDPDSNPFTTDKDGLEVADDKVYKINLGNSYNYKSLSAVTTAEGCCNIEPINGDYVYIRQDGQAYKLSDDSLYLDTVDTDIKNTSYIKDSLGNISAVIYTKAMDTENGTSGDAVFGKFCDNGEWGKPVQLTEPTANVYYDSIDAEIVKDKLIIEAVAATVDLSGEEVERTSELKTSIYEYKNDIIVNSAEISSSDIKSGNDVTLKASVTNNSANTLDSVNVTIYEQDGSVAVSTFSQNVNLKSGETNDLSFNFTAPDIVDGNYKVKIEASNESDDTDNTAEFALSFADLAIYGKQIVLNDINYLVATVQNSGSKAASGTMYVIKDVYSNTSTQSADDSCLYKISFENLEPDQSKFYKISVDDDFYSDNETTGIVTLYTEPTAETVEYNKENNYEHISTVNVTDTASAPDTVTAGETPYFIDSYVVNDISTENSDVSVEFVSNGYTLSDIPAAEPSDYSVSNSTLTLSRKFVKELGEGTHVIDITFTKGSNTITKELTLINDVKFCKATWNVNGTVTEGDYIPAGTVPTFTGNTDKPNSDGMTYKFSGWDVDGDGAIDIEATEDIQEICQDTTFTAVYESAPITYTVSWDTDGRVTTKDYVKDTIPQYSGSTEKPSTSTKTYGFMGWDSDSDGVADILPDEEFPKVNGNQSYVAVYKEALPIAVTSFTVDVTAEKYTGSEITKQINSTLTENKDYKVTYKNNVNAGEAIIVITGMGVYGGKLEYTFEIRNGVYVGSTRFATLAAAFAAVPTDGTNTDVTMYSDLTAATKCYINEGQNINLDMNGCKFTSTAVSGYALNVQSDGKLSINNGTLEVPETGAFCVLDGGTAEKIDNVSITAGKQALNNSGTVSSITNSTLCGGTIAVYNTGTIGKIVSIICNGTTYGLYNAGTVTFAGTGVYSADEAKNAFYTSEIGSAGMINDGEQYAKFTKNLKVVYIAPSNTSNVKVNIYSSKAIPTELKGTDSTYFGIPSYITDNKTATGYFGTGSVICEYDSNGNLKSSKVLVLSGDIDGDSACDVIDLSIVERVTNGNAVLGDVQKSAADNNSDEVVDINDYRDLVNIALQ